MEENLIEAAKLSNWLIEKVKKEPKIADLIAARKFKVTRGEVSHTRQLLKPKQVNLI
jgi:hypothetical protein